MMKRQRHWQKLISEEGSAPIYALIILMVLMLLFGAVSEYIRLKIIAEGVYEATQNGVISVATKNYDEVYNGLRQGYSGAYGLSDTKKWQQVVEDGAVMEDLNQLLGLDEGKKLDGGRLVYEISDLHVIIENPSFAPEEDLERFEATVDLTLKVPLGFGWDHLAPLIIPMRVKAAYSNKF